MPLEKAVQRVFDRANLIGEGADVYGLMLQYKALEAVYYTDIHRFDAIYDEIVKDLGF